METQFIEAPSSEIRILDIGEKRRIFINGKAIHNGKKTQITETIETPLSYETIKLLVKLKGDWWLDEIERRSNKKYIRSRLESLIKRFTEIKDARILDIGSGSGSSALVLLDCGAKNVHGIEPNSDFVDLANLRARDEGLADKVFFTHLTDTTNLPFDDNKYDIITLNAVLEHVPLKIREPIIKEAYRCLKPSGLLIITETPNRIFPYDGHTTHLPLIPWLPLDWAVAIAKKFSRNSPKGLTKEQYISEGLVGASYWQIKKALPDAQCLNTQGGDAEWKTLRRKRTKIFYPILKLIELFLKLFKIPLTAVMPVLDLVFKK